MEMMQWVRGATIGKGTFASVNLAIPSPAANTQTAVAVKSCSTSSKAAAASLKNERQVLTELPPSPYIIRLLGEGHSTEQGQRLYNLFLEYASGGTLAEKIGNFPRGLPEADIRRHTRAVVEALSQVHASGFVHCDVKPANILLFSDGGAKLADFGLAKRAAEMGGGGARGTPMYMSPEEVAGEGTGAAADVWALGCTVAEMATGAPAWGRAAAAAAEEGGGGVGGLLLRIGRGEETPLIPASLTEEGRDFLGRCLVRDGRRRWTAEMLLDHPFLGGDLVEEGGVGGKEEVLLSLYSPRAPFEFAAAVGGRWSELQRSVWSPPGRAVGCWEEGLGWVVEAGRRRVEELALHCQQQSSWSEEAAEFDGWLRVR